MKSFTSKKIDSHGIVFILLWIWIFSNFFTSIDTKWLPGLKGTYSGLHIHNILFIFFIVYAIVKNKWKMPKEYKYIFFLFAEMTLVWFLNMYQFGLNSGYISTVYGILIMICIAAMGDCLDMDMINCIFESVAILMAVFISCNILVYLGDVINSLSAGWAHPNIKCFVGGGHNLEAVWMTMVGVFIRKQWRYRYWLFTTILSVIYLSRTGVLVNLVLLFIYMYQSDNKSKIKQVLLILCAVIVALLVIYITGLFDNIWIRFVNTGNEVGSVSRLIIWKAIIQGIKDRPFGVGCGNTMRFLAEAYSLPRAENNAHNIFLQFFLENNIVGFLLLMYGWIKIGVRQFRDKFSNPCGTFLLLYAFQGLFQMQLKEPLLFLVLALYFVVPNNKTINELENIR